MLIQTVSCFKIVEGEGSVEYTVLPHSAKITKEDFKAVNQVEVAKPFYSLYEFVDFTGKKVLGLNCFDLGLGVYNYDKLKRALTKCIADDWEVCLTNVMKVINKRFIKKIV